MFQNEPPCFLNSTNSQRLTALLSFVRNLQFYLLIINVLVCRIVKMLKRNVTSSRLSHSASQNRLQRNPRAGKWQTNNKPSTVGRSISTSSLSHVKVFTNNSLMVTNNILTLQTYRTLDSFVQQQQLSPALPRLNYGPLKKNNKISSPFNDVGYLISPVLLHQHR